MKKKNNAMSLFVDEKEENVEKIFAGKREKLYERLQHEIKIQRVRRLGGRNFGDLVNGSEIELINSVSASRRPTRGTRNFRPPILSTLVKYSSHNFPDIHPKKSFKLGYSGKPAAPS